MRKIKPAINELRSQLSAEWNKPKAQNIKEEWDKREARSYERIKQLQEDINLAKTTLLTNKIS